MHLAIANAIKKYKMECQKLNSKNTRHPFHWCEYGNELHKVLKMQSMQNL